MIAYEGKYAPLLVRWWAELQDSGDFARTVHSSIHDLDAFIVYFRGPAALMFEADHQGIWFAASAAPFFDGALWDVWIRKDRRHTKSALKAIELSYTLALEKYPSLFGLTQQQELHGVHLKLGYTYRGNLLSNMDGQNQYVYQLTRDGWANRRAAASLFRHAKQEQRIRNLEIARSIHEHSFTNGAA